MSNVKQSGSRGYSPPVDSDGYQCGVCLLNRRQCVACARKEAEAEDEDRAEARADDDAAIYWGFDQADDVAYFNAVDYERSS